MDSDIVKSFRMRLKRAGFENISLRCARKPYPIYYLRCIDQHGKLIMRTITETQMEALPKIIWFE